MIISRYSQFSLLFLMFFSPQICETSRHEPKLIIVMGASCSGKSTLSAKLSRVLDDEWKFVELDVIEDELKSKKVIVTDDQLIAAVVNQINEHLECGYSVVVDTNMHDHTFTKICCDCKLFVLVYCPLKVLLERNAERDIELQRSSRRAYYAQDYVLKTFYNFENHQNYDVKIDSSLLSLDESVEKVFALIVEAQVVTQHNK